MGGIGPRILGLAADETTPVRIAHDPRVRAVQWRDQCLTAFFAVWTVHHDCDRYHFIARTVRNRARNVMTLSMFFHVEHHLFPGVPTCHLDVVAQRLDATAPELSRMRVF
jgi:fatty acid desaturase